MCIECAYALPWGCWQQQEQVLALLNHLKFRAIAAKASTDLRSFVLNSIFGRKMFPRAPRFSRNRVFFRDLGLRYLDGFPSSGINVDNSVLERCSYKTNVDNTSKQSIQTRCMRVSFRFFVCFNTPIKQYLIAWRRAVLLNDTDCVTRIGSHISLPTSHDKTHTQ